MLWELNYLLLFAKVKHKYNKVVLCPILSYAQPNHNTNVHSI